MINDISPESRNEFLLALLFELTIVGRMIWAEDELTDPRKQEALKWLNEINHRILNVHNNPDISLAALQKTIQHHVTQGAIPDGWVTFAWNRAVFKVQDD